jgi:lipoprotein signal peptidase
MRARRQALVLLAVVFATIDLTHKLVVHAQYHHVRSPYVTVAMVAVIVGLVSFVPRVPSRTTLVGAAVAVGGALGNLLSLFIWGGHGVPDPLVVQGASNGIAFNLADVFAVAGDVVMIAAVALYGLRHRAMLEQRA